MGRCKIRVRVEPAGSHRGRGPWVACIMLLGALIARAQEPPVAPPSQDAQVKTLIEQLGSREYSQREQARADLAELGVQAFDALHEAQLHEDMEIRKQAEYLVRAIRVAWIREDDSPEVKQILRNYHGGSLEDRRSRLQRLARVSDGAALEPLCRLVRFETSDHLSKRAALFAMAYPLPPVPDRPHAWSETIDHVIGSSQRTGARWLRLYARYLQDPASTLDDWVALAEEESRELQSRPDKLRLQLLRDFLRWQVDMWERQGRREQAIATMRRTLPLQNATRPELLETIDWLLEREAWPLIEALAQQFPDSFRRDPYLMYRRAESLRRQGKSVAAEQLADQARQSHIEGELFLHVELGRELQQRGLVDWAEREYRQTIDSCEEGSHPNLEARIRLGWLLHDLARHAEAYAALQGIIELMDRNTTIVRRLQELQRDPNRIRGQMHFSRSLEYHQHRQYEQEREQLDQAFRHDSLNADILIAMHRTPQAPESWRKQTRQRIERLTRQFRAAVLAAERSYQATPTDVHRDQLALMLNQFAWLAANTGGDGQAALESSRRSLELIPDDPGYLDTLGRCYFALGDYDNAIKQQRRAVELEPHSGQIRRQLERFEKEREKVRAERDASSAAPSKEPGES